jgi:hypothetical protein
MDQLATRLTNGIDNTISVRHRPGMKKSRANASTPTSEVPIPFLSAFHELFDGDDLWAAARQMGAVTRERKVDVSALAESSVLAMSGLPGTQTTIFANYIQLTGQTLAPSAFYDRFTVPFANLMADVSRRAIAAVRAVEPTLRDIDELEGLLRHFVDVQVADSTCQVLRKLAAHWSPSTSPKRPASFKLHSVISLKDNLPIEQHLSPQRDHDNPQLADEVLTPGALFLADLGYTDHGRLIRLKRRGVHVLMRLKSNEDPRIRRVHVGVGDKRLCRTMKLDEALGLGALNFKSERLDVDVVITGKLDGKTVEEVFRVVGIAPTDGGEDRYYLTTVPRDILTPDDVALSYSLRWEIELLWKHMKTGAGLAAIRAWRPAAIFALVHAKITAVALARLLELAAKPPTADHATGQLAIVLTLNRAVPMIIALRMRGQNVDLAEMERRIVLLATILGRSRRQRRERARKAKRKEITGRA